MTSDEIVRLLDTAVPPIPPGLHDAPLDRIRRRARGRRTIAVTTGAGVAVLAVTLAAGLFSARPAGGPAPQIGDVPGTTAAATTAAATTAAAPSPSVPSTQALGSFRVARVDRAGTGVTVYVSSPGACRTWAPGGSTVDERTDGVVITVAGEPESVECSRAIDTPVQITLSQPLGERTVVDGRAQGVDILVVRDADLPVVPARWWEVPSDYVGLDGSRFAFSYTTPGGPDLNFSVERGVNTLPVLEQVRIGPYDAVIVDYNREEAVRWMVRDLVYTMTLMPTEGATTSLEELHSVLAQLT